GNDLKKRSIFLLARLAVVELSDTPILYQFWRFIT
ncbi:MAG: hypothetical protein ACI8VT_004410, partial [Saprospiraceae bacterium]